MKNNILSVFQLYFRIKKVKNIHVTWRHTFTHIIKQKIYIKNLKETKKYLYIRMR